MTSEPNDRRDRGDSSGPNGVAEFAEVAEVAGSFARSFPAVYLRFHRRDEELAASYRVTSGPPAPRPLRANYGR